MIKITKYNVSEEEYERIINSLTQQYEQVRDVYDRRWIKCKICGECKPSEEFISYGGIGTMNLGECRFCHVMKITREIFEK